MLLRYQLVRPSTCWLIVPSVSPWPRSNSGWRKHPQHTAVTAGARVTVDSPEALIENLLSTSPPGSGSETGERIDEHQRGGDDEDRSMKALVLTSAIALWADWASAADVSFDSVIRPILSESCFQCHGPSKDGRRAGLRLDQTTSAFAIRDGKRAIAPGKPELSELIHRITSTDPDVRMPPPETKKPPLQPAQVAQLREWIQQGARYEDHWSFVPPRGNPDRALRRFIDQRIREHLQAKGLPPSPRADQTTLIRRLSLDLRGLPPTIEEIETFLADASKNAWESLVDRFLASPECAERLALEWLDVARYSDTNGYSIDDHRDMWGWRDWSIHAFLQNKPYDDFIVEQLAGDLLPDATAQQKMATGFLRNSMNTHEGGTIREEYRVAYIADKIDTVSTAFMGLTMKCAQCHDHKYDPISQKDYYRFFAFFNNASENGGGAQNGNTAPVVRAVSPLEEHTAYGDSIRMRIDRLKYLQSHLSELEPERFAEWRAKILARADAAPRAREVHATTKFSFPVGTQPRWIWPEKKGTIDHILLRRSVELDEAPLSAWLFFTCDDHADVYFNGKNVGRVKLWMKPKTVDVTDKLTKGVNLIGVEARNAGSVAGFLAVLQIHHRSGKVQYVLSDPEWKWRKPLAATSAADALAKDGDWQSPLSLGTYGVGPWGKLEGIESSELSPSALAEILRKPVTQRSEVEATQVSAAFAAQSTRLVQRFKKALSIEVGELEKRLKGGKTSVMVMDSAKPRKNRILMRGQYDQPGEEVSAGVPSLFQQLPDDAPTDRLALARWLVDKSHPLTARVTVNRYWQLLFGSGLVKTAEDFGAQGERPSHPELLDGMAVAFRENGWNLRDLLREIVLSKTYQQQSRLGAELRRADPYNRLLARAPRQRLSAELVRDNALAIGGLLKKRLGGPSVYPPQPDGLWRQVSHFGYGAFTAQAYFPGAHEHLVRRSMYTFWKRTAPPPAMAIFDAPTRETCVVRRLATNTPLQALVLMNDPQFLNAARALGERMIREGGSSATERISHAFRLATARFPRAEELRILEAGLAREKRRFRSDPTAAAALVLHRGAADEQVDLAAYTMTASTILNLDETITNQ